MKRVIKKCPITFYDVDGWQVLIHDVDVFNRGETPCENCMYDDEVDYISDAPCDVVHGCTRYVHNYFIFVEGYLSDETGKEGRK